jgi:hypothetical protein
MKGKSMLLSYSDSEGKQVFTPSKDIRLVRGGVKLVGHLVNGVYLDKISRFWQNLALRRLKRLTINVCTCNPTEQNILCISPSLTVKSMK